MFFFNSRRQTKYKFRMEMLISIVFTVLTVKLTLFNTVACDSCVQNAQDFVNVMELTDHFIHNILELDFVMYSMFIYDFLNKCRFEPILHLKTHSHCEKACSIHKPCLAYVFVDGSIDGTGCELCMTETRGATDVMDLQHAYEYVMIGMQAIRQHILGDVFFLIS